jgi:hypothetical protein
MSNFLRFAAHVFDTFMPIAAWVLVGYAVYRFITL